MDLEKTNGKKVVLVIQISYSWVSSIFQKPYGASHLGISISLPICILQLQISETKCMAKARFW